MNRIIHLFSIFLFLLFMIAACSETARPKQEEKQTSEQEPTGKKKKLLKSQMQHDFDTIVSLIGGPRVNVYLLMGDPMLADEEGNDIMKNWLMIYYDEMNNVSQILFTFNTDAGSYTGTMPVYLAPNLTIEKTRQYHGEPDEVLQNEYFHILDYTISKGYKFVFDRSNLKLFRIYVTAAGA